MSLARRYKVVVWDVYGTLLEGTTWGNFSLQKSKTYFQNKRLKKIFRNYGIRALEGKSSRLGLIGKNFWRKWQKVIQKKKNWGIKNPEADQLLIWKVGLSDFLKKEKFPGSVFEKTFFTVEQAVHPAKVYPDAVSVIQHLRKCGIKQGIVSNAQSYTLKHLEHNFKKLAPSFQMYQYFSKELIYLSYQYGWAKPHLELFALMKYRLDQMKILPYETLYIGNNLIQDIRPAAHFGWDTLYFRNGANFKKSGRVRLNSCLEISFLREIMGIVT